MRISIQGIRACFKSVAKSCSYFDGGTFFVSEPSMSAELVEVAVATALIALVPSTHELYKVDPIEAS